MRRVENAAGLPDETDLLVIGAGPAGLAAASLAAEHGAAVLLVDENAFPGGQIYRGITTTPLLDRAILGADYWHGAALIEKAERVAAAYAQGGTVWSVSAPSPIAEGARDLEVGISLAGAARMVRARQVIAATGALERPMPVPGWTLPGVMTAGAAQIALKTAGLVPKGRVVIAGCGPLLYLLAAQLRAAGASIEAVLDTTPGGNWKSALPHLPGFLASPYLLKGAKLLVALRRTTPVFGGVTAFAATGDGRLDSIIYRKGNSADRRIACDVLLLHQGVVPNVNLSNAVGCEHLWDSDQAAWRPRVDSWFETTVEGFAVAGDGAGIGGAEAAAHRGTLAALGCLQRLGVITGGERDRQSMVIRAALGRATRGRRFLDKLYKPGIAFRAPADPSTLVCRCEEVSAGAIRDAVALGVTGPNQLKSFLRAGMGPCQGRLCGLTVTEIIAQERRVSPAEVGGYRLRPPVKPVTVREIASLPKTEAGRRAVEL